MSNEDKMLEEQAIWKSVDADMAAHAGIITYHDEAYKAGIKACAAIKDAEITNLEKHNKDLRDNALANEQANYSQIERLVKERASRDLMIKELREALDRLMLLESRGRIMPIGKEWDAARKALANSEHHNSRALEKALLETRIDQMECVLAWHPLEGSHEEYAAGLMRACKAKLAELNKEQ